MPPLAAKTGQPGFARGKTGQPRSARGNAFPLWWPAPPPFPRNRGHYKAPLCCELLMKGLLCGALFCPACGGSPAQRERGEASAASQPEECLLCHMTQKDESVTLTLYSSPAGRYHNPRPERPSNLRTLRPSGRSILRTFSFTTLLHNPPPAGGHNPRGAAPSTLMCAFCIECASQPK